MRPGPTSSVSLGALLLCVAPATGFARQGGATPPGGHQGGGSPSRFAARRAATATPPLGATEKTEKAVLEGLRWLLRHQNDDGSWGASTLAAHCSAGHPCIPADAAVSSDHDEGLTALALLTFLGQGISTGSKLEIVDALTGKKYAAGGVVRKGIEWLVSRSREHGATPGVPLYDDALTAMALCEAYGLSADRAWKEPAQRAIDRLVSAQELDPQGSRSGWFDLPGTTWAVLALNTARLSGISVPGEVLQGGLAYAKSAALDAGSAAPSALSMLVRTFTAHDIADPFLDTAAQRLVLDAPTVSADKRSIDYPYWHLATLALSQFDGPDSPRTPPGKYWTPWNEKLVPALLSLQDDGARGGCSRGGWLQEDDASRRSGHALYTTALNVLTLESDYLYPNVFRAK